MWNHKCVCRLKNKYFSFTAVTFNIMLIYYSPELRLIYAICYLQKELTVYSIKKTYVGRSIDLSLAIEASLSFSLLTQRATALQIASVIVK